MMARVKQVPHVRVRFTNALILLGIVITNAAIAQVPKNVTATTDQRCYALIKDEFVASTPPGKGGIIQQISEPVKCTATVTNQPTWVIDSYAWNGVDPKGNNIVDFKGSNTGQTATGYLHAPGTAKLGCLVTYHLTTDPAKTPQYAQAFSKIVYCVGGPIQYGVVSGAIGTPNRHANATTAAPGPAYSQYFTVDPTKTTPPGWQTPQSVTASPYGNQPTTVTYSWTVPSNFVLMSPGGLTAFTITFGAVGVSNGDYAKLSYQFYNNDANDPVSRSVNDDSDKCMYLDPNTDAGAVDPDLGKAGAYMPKTLVFMNKTTTNLNPPLVQTDYCYQLQDQTNTPMPGVYIAERWDNATIAAANTFGCVWPPQVSAYLDDSFSWDTGAPYTHPYSGGNPIQSGNHWYYAATTNGGMYQATGLPGIKVFKTFTVWYDDATTNNPTPLRGTQ